MITTVNIIKDYISSDIEIINRYEDLDFNNSIVIMFFGDLNIDATNTTNKIILIMTEHYKNLNSKTLEFINNSKNYYIWDFSPTNIKQINKNYPNINNYYLPPLYNPYLELYYQQTIAKKVDYKDKPIDVLFMGTINERRQKIIDELKKSYKVKRIVIEDKLSFNEIFDLIENSKLVLNVFYYDVFTFDYYRNSLLLSNNILMVSEYPYNVDTNIEENLKGLEENLIFSDYDNLIDTVKQTLEKSPEEIKTITEKTYNWYKQHDMRTYVYNFFTTIFTV
jgi:hypothetical protein